MEQQDFKSFDRSKALDRAGGGEERFVELLEFFITYSVQLEEGLEAAFASGKISEIAEASHKLKGALSMVGATVAFHRAEALELAARSEESSRVKALAMLLKEDLVNLRGECQSYLRG